MAPADPIDPVTGLVGREHLLRRLSVILDRLTHDPSPVGLLFIDLDHFAEATAGMDRAGGDALLREIADRIDRTIRTGDVAGRWGEDEFVVLFAAPVAPGEAVVVADRVLDEVGAASHPGGPMLTASIGIAFADRPGPAGHVVDEARTAAMLRGDAGGDGWTIFDDQLRRQVRWRRRWAADLRDAVERDQFVLRFQPIVELSTGRLTGAEALVRWQHPQEGEVEPADFVPLAEQLGLAPALGRTVLWRAIAQAGEWSRLLGDRPFTMSINVSAHEVADPDLVAFVADRCHAHGVDPAQVRVELTETAVLGDRSGAVARLAALRELGVTVALDDFGTGQASLSALRDLPVDVLKIDASFVSGLPRSTDRAVVALIVGLARELGLVTVAEGVETEEQAAALRDAGVDAAQGLLFGAPVTGVEFARLSGG